MKNQTKIYKLRTPNDRARKRDKQKTLARRRARNVKYATQMRNL